jgi:hypothetical protein
VRPMTDPTDAVVHAERTSSDVSAEAADLLADLARRARDRGALEPRVVTALRLIADAVGVAPAALIEAAQAALADVVP